MSKTKGARNFKRSIFAVYDKDEQCVCTGFVEDLVVFFGFTPGRTKGEQKIYTAACNGRRIFYRYKVIKVDEEITGNGRRKKKWK